MNEIPQIMAISLAKILPKNSTRLTNEEIQPLADSIKQYGMLQPIIVRQVNDSYEIISGERRYKAAQLNNMAEVPCIIMNIDEKKSLELSLVENIQNKELSPIEEAKLYQKILSAGNLTPKDLSLRIGKDENYITKKLNLLSLTEEVQNALLSNQISEKHARSLLQITDPIKQKELLNRIITERLTVKQLSDQISLIPNDNPPKKEEPDNILSNPFLSQDVVNIADLNQPESQQLPDSTNIQNALNDLNIVNTSSDVFNDTEEIVEDANDKTQIININQIKEQAKDILSEEPKTPIEDLLKKEGNINMNNNNNNTNQPNQPVTFAGKFFPSLEEESTNMSTNNMSSPNNNVPLESSFPDAGISNAIPNVPPLPVSQPAMNQMNNINNSVSNTPFENPEMTNIPLPPNNNIIPVEPNPSVNNFQEPNSNLNLNPLGVEIPMNNQEMGPNPNFNPLPPVGMAPNSNVNPVPPMANSPTVNNNPIPEWNTNPANNPMPSMAPPVNNTAQTNSINQVKMMLNNLINQGNSNIHYEELSLPGEYQIIIKIGN